MSGAHVKKRPSQKGDRAKPRARFESAKQSTKISDPDVILIDRPSQFSFSTRCPFMSFALDSNEILGLKIGGTGTRSISRR